MPTVKADISIRLDIEVKAESYDVAEELIQQFLYIGSDDKRVGVTSGADIDVNSMESDELALEEETS